MRQHIADAITLIRMGRPKLAETVLTLALRGELGKPDYPADEDYLSKCPPGFDTVLGFLAKHYPERLDCMDNTADATLRDGYWLKARCYRRCISPIKVKACPFLVRQGIFEVNAYPLELLRERFG